MNHPFVRSAIDAAERTRIGGFAAGHRRIDNHPVEFWLRLLLILAVGYVVAAGLLYLLQDRLIFFPQPPGLTPSGDRVVPAVVERPDASLHGWVVNPERTGVLIVYFGGNAEEVSQLVETFARLDATTVLMNYRGYGRSGGRPSARALVADADAVVADTRRRFGTDRPLLLFGRSLGTGIAVLATRKSRADGVVLLSPYRSLAHVAQRAMPLFPVGLLMRHRIDTAAGLATLPPRVLVLHSTNDRVVPTDESIAFIATLQTPPEVVTFAGAHNVPMEHPRLWRAIARFVGSFSIER